MQIFQTKDCQNVSLLNDISVKINLYCNGLSFNYVEMKGGYI